MRPFCGVYKQLQTFLGGGGGRKLLVDFSLFKAGLASYSRGWQGSLPVRAQINVQW